MEKGTDDNVMMSHDVIDLNVVLHSETEEEDENDQHKLRGNQEEEEDKEEEEDEYLKEQDLHTESESLLASDDEGAVQDGVGLVNSLDNIPEDTFMKMISGDVTAGSCDLTRNDINDITGGSCDPIIGSHDQGGLIALILTPTRELALQVQRHICAAAKYTNIQVYTVEPLSIKDTSELYINRTLSSVSDATFVYILNSL